MSIGCSGSNHNAFYLYSATSVGINRTPCWYACISTKKQGCYTVISIPRNTPQIKQTRLHSSRMHTARLLTISPSMHCAGGCLVPRGVCSRVSAPEMGGGNEYIMNDTYPSINVFIFELIYLIQMSIRNVTINCNEI